VRRKRSKGKGKPGFFRDLSRSPAKPWPQGAIHHGFRIFLLVFLAAFITFLFPAREHLTLTPYQAGMVAEEDLLAEIPFTIPKTQDELARDRATAEAVIPPVFEYRTEARDSMAANLRRFFDQVQRAAEEGGIAAVDQVLAREGISALQGQAELLLDPQNLETLRTAAQRVAEDLMPSVLDDNDARGMDAERIVVRYETGEERSIPTDSLLWGRAFLLRAFETLDPSRPELESVFRILVIRYFASSFHLDQAATAQARRQARQAVPLSKGSILAGQAILRRGEPITEQDVELIGAYESALGAQGMFGSLQRDWGPLLGNFVLNLLLLGLYGLLLFFFRAEVYRNFRWILLQGVLVLTYFLAAWGVSSQDFPSELLPIAFVALPIAVLWDGRMALVLALLLSVLSAAQPPFEEFSILVVTLVGGGVAALSARAVRRRSQTWIFIALITLGYALAILSQAMVNEFDPTVVAASVLWAGGNATASAILAMGFMPVFEWVTGITTDQTLLEWADPNRPLLKRLSMEAGGTYAHTINVANLAEAAATAIGANGLLTRVGIYYHDVGKILKPHFFVENQPGGRNPHDKLKPQTSAAIVREHVIEGERMARDAGVPDLVARFIPEHHGTQLIGFFYEKAKEESDAEPDPREFRYPGPKPQSRETAIAMLADSVESATRALQNPSPERVRDLVRTIVEGKIRDGQLSESPLTLREINAIQEQFAKVVEGMFHHRLDYPATRHITDNGGEQGRSSESSLPEARTGDGPWEGPSSHPVRPAPVNPDRGGSAPGQTPPDPANQKEP
jgi:putative nucleotidyltransferase with HDIG domain